MTDYVLDICRLGDSVYLSLPAKLGGGASDRDLWLLEVGDDLCIDVTPQSLVSSLSIIVRLNRRDLEQQGQMPRIDHTVLRIGATRIPLEPVMRTLGPEADIHGHMATIAKGKLMGWVTDPSDPHAEVPVEVRKGDDVFLAMTSGVWPHSELRSFSLQLPTYEALARVQRVDALAGPNGQTFARAPFLAVFTTVGWLIGGAASFSNGILTGAFLLAPNPYKPVRVRLNLADGSAHDAVCDRASTHNFGSTPCAFRISSLDPDTLDGATVTFLHDTLEAPMTLPLDAFLVDIPNGQRINLHS